MEREMLEQRRAVEQVATFLHTDHVGLPRRVNQPLRQLMSGHESAACIAQGKAFDRPRSVVDGQDLTAAQADHRVAVAGLQRPGYPLEHGIRPRQGVGMNPRGVVGKYRGEDRDGFQGVLDFNRLSSRPGIEAPGLYDRDQGEPSDALAITDDGVCASRT